jgi:hypothetical protein
VAALTVDGFIGSLKTTVKALLVATSVARLAGEVELALGAIVSGTGVGVVVG